jgi:hypothetical protein
VKKKKCRERKKGVTVTATVTWIRLNLNIPLGARIKGVGRIAQAATLQLNPAMPTGLPH